VFKLTFKTEVTCFVYSSFINCLDTRFITLRYATLVTKKPFTKLVAQYTYYFYIVTNSTPPKNFLVELVANRYYYFTLKGISKVILE
jgi:hypothetical protein